MFASWFLARGVHHIELFVFVREQGAASGKSICPAPTPVDLVLFGSDIDPGVINATISLVKE